MPLSGAPIISPRTSLAVCSRFAEVSAPNNAPTLTHIATRLFKFITGFSLVELIVFAELNELVDLIERLNELDR
jgi:hypothetical protein